MKRKKGSQRQGDRFKHSLWGKLEDECLWNEESNCIFLLHLLKVSLLETNTASERQLYKKTVLRGEWHEFLGDLGFLHIWTQLGPQMV